jgi:anti-sigma-K factor RskA
MNDLRCSEIDDLLAVYAADALDEDERCTVASHIAECRNHDAELAAVRLDFERIALAVGPVEPPPSLRSSLLDAFDREVAGPAVAPVALPQAAPAPTNGARPSAQRGWFSTASLGYALAAALLLVAIGVGAWGLSRGGDDQVTVVASSEGANSLQLTYLEDRQIALLEVDLSAPPAGQAYQAWQIVDGAPVSIGVLNTNSGRVAFSTDLGDASAIALSVEPMGGSAAPTTTPILMTALEEG